MKARCWWRYHYRAMNPQVRALLSKVGPGLTELCRRYGVRKLDLFGSALTPEWDEAESDLDFIADFGPPPAGIDLFAQQFVFQVELEKLLGRKVDLLERCAIRKPLFLERVASQAQEVYAD